MRVNKNCSIAESKVKMKTALACAVFLVEGGGFEPPKSRTADLQSAPFGHSGTPPKY